MILFSNKPIIGDENGLVSLFYGNQVISMNYSWLSTSHTKPCVFPFNN